MPCAPLSASPAQCFAVKRKCRPSGDMLGHACSESETQGTVTATDGPPDALTRGVRLTEAISPFRSVKSLGSRLVEGAHPDLRHSVRATRRIRHTSPVG